MKKIKLDLGEKSKTEYFFEYLHAKPMTSCALLMIFPGILIPAFLFETTSWGVPLWIIFAFVLGFFGQQYESGPDPSHFKGIDSHGRIDISEEERIYRELKRKNKIKKKID